MVRIIKAAEWPGAAAALPDVKMMLDPLVPAWGKTLLHGPPGSGKSALMWGVGNAVATGMGYLNLSTIRSRVLLLSTDMSMYELKHRWGGNFAPLFDVLCVNGFDITKPAFARSGLYAAVKRHIEAEQIGLVMIDALGGIHSGRSARDDEVADEVDHRLSEWLPDTALLLLGHDRKMRYNQDGDILEPGVEDFLGSQKWRANMTSQVHMWPVGEYISKVQHAKCQVAQRLSDSIRVYIDIHGRAELWDSHRAIEVGRLYQDAVKKLGIENLSVNKQIEAVAKYYGKSERTIKRWRAMFLGGDK